jgi:hypothetical protein
MVESNNSAVSKMTGKRFGCLQVFGFIVAAVIITAGITVLIFKTYFFPSAFKPVTLNPHEEQVLTAKLEKLDTIGTDLNSQKKDISKKPSKADRSDSGGTLEPEPYSEKNSKREIVFTERELNALLAKNTNLARKLAIDLSDDLVSAKLLVPVDKDFPVLGGKILRVRTGVVFTYLKGKPVVIFKGVSIMGVPIPNAWLGGIKNIDLVKEFGAGKGFWKTFSDGVEDIKVTEGRLKITLKE